MIQYAIKVKGTDKVVAFMDGSEPSLEGFDVEPTNERIRNWPEKVNGSSELVIDNGNVLWRDTRDLLTVKAQAWEKIKHKRLLKERSNFKCNGNNYQMSIDRLSVAVTGALISKMQGKNFTITWTLADNSTVELDADEMIAVGNEMVKTMKAIHETSESLRTFIECITGDYSYIVKTLDELDWPEQEV